MGMAGAQDGHTCDNIDNLSLSLWLLAWLGSALAEVCQFTGVSISGSQVSAQCALAAW